MNRRRAFLTLGAVAVSAVVVPAGAAASWSLPQTIGGPFESALISEAPVTVAGDFGPPLTVVDVTTQARDKSTRDTIRLLPQNGRQRTLDGSRQAGPVGYGSRRFALLRERALRKGRQRLEVVLGDTSGETGRPHALTTTAFQGVGRGLGLAASPQGAVAAAWLDCPSTLDCDRGAYRVRVARRAPGGRFRRALTVASGFVGSESGELEVALAFGRRGELLVAYTQPGKRRVQARTLQRDSMSAAQTLGRHEEITSLRAAAADNGRLLVAWATQDYVDDGELQLFGPPQLRAAIRPVGARTFGQTQLVDKGRVSAPLFAPQLGVARDGTATLAWTQQAESPQARFPILVATAGPRGRFGEPEQLSPSARLLDLALAPDGTALALWRCIGPSQSDSTSTGGLAAAIRQPATQNFQTAEAVTADPVDRATAFLDPISSQPSVVWASPPIGATGRAVAVLQANRGAERSETSPACPAPR